MVSSQIQIERTAAGTASRIDVKTVVTSLITLVLICPISFAAPSEKSIQTKITFDVELETIGPAVETWTIQYSGGAKVKLHVSALNGSLDGKFLVSEQYLSDLKNTIEREQFYSLPKSINEKFVTTGVTGHQAIAFPVDGPELRMSIFVNGKSHSVRVPDPEFQSDLPEVKRVLTVLDKITSILPVKPQWH
jgi:mRNA-degrading endonuclease HigB of HigAB toxin-antitoxin module